MTEMSILSLGDCEQIADIGPLAGMTRMTKLWLDSPRVTDYRPLAGMNRLSALTLRKCSGLADLAPLAGADL